MRTAIFALLVVALLLPTASAMTIDLYPHIAGNADAPMNTIAPPEKGGETVRIGIATHSGCASDPAELQHYTDRQYHTWYAYQTQSTIDYDQHERDIQSFPHGLLDNLTIRAADGHVTWFFATRTAPDYAGPTPAVIPQVVVEATLRVDPQSADRVTGADYDEGVLIAQGRIGPIDLYPGATHPGLSTHEVDGETVYGFSFPMTAQGTSIPRGHGMVLRIDAYVDQPLCSEGRMMPDWLLVHSSPGLRPTLRFQADNPLQFYTVHGSVNTEARVTVAASSAFGHADTNMSLVSDLPFTLWGYDDGTYRCHDCGLEPPRWTFTLPTWALADAAAGTYALTLQAQNLAGTATLNQTVWLTLPSGTFCLDEACLEGLSTDKGSPGLPMVVVLGLLALLARRRG